MPIDLQKDTTLPYPHLVSSTWPRITHSAIELHLPHCLHHRVPVSIPVYRVQLPNDQSHAIHSLITRRAPRLTASSKDRHPLLEELPLWPNKSQRYTGMLQYSLYVLIESSLMLTSDVSILLNIANYTCRITYPSMISLAAKVPTQ